MDDEEQDNEEAPIIPYSDKEWEDVLEMLIGKYGAYHESN